MDYYALNKITIKNKYLVLLVQNLMDRLSGVSIFMKLDFRSGYWQGRIAIGHKHKMNFITRYDSYMFLVMLFGLTNALTTFCNLMNDMIYEFLDDFMVMYLDEIVVYSTSIEDHVVHLSRVLNRSREYKLFIKKDKCDFACSEIIFVGHLVSMGQVRIDLKEV